MSKQPIAVVFGGAWSRGNQRYWMQHVSSWYEKRGYRVIVLPYGQGCTSYDMLIQYIVWQLRNSGVLDENNNVIRQIVGVPYSMGGDLVRLLAAMFPGLFCRVDLLASTNRYGMDMLGVARGIATVPAEFFVGILTMNEVKLNDVNRTRKLLFNDMDFEPGMEMARALIENSDGEPFINVLSLLPPVHLLFGSTMPLTCSVVAIRPRQDVMFRGITYPDENVDVIDVDGGHGFIMQRDKCHAALDAAAKSPNYVEPWR